MTDQLDLAFARRTDPDTSKAAAKTVRAGSLKDVVLQALREYPMTTNEIADATGRKLVSISPRMAPLRDDGFVEDSGLRRMGESRTPSIVWKLTGS